MTTGSYARELEDKISRGPGWIYIVQQLTNALDPAIDKFGTTQRVDCPFPDDHNKSGGKNRFRLFEHFDQTGKAICTCNCGRARKGFSLLMDLGVATTFSDLLRKVKAVLNDGEVTRQSFKRKDVPTDPYATFNTPKKVEKRRMSLRKVGKELLPLYAPSAEPARLYLEKRGLLIEEWSQIVRFHPRLPHFKQNEDKRYTLTGYYPAIVTLMSAPDGTPVTFHRIYITDDGDKAPLGDDESVKSVMPAAIKGSLPGSAIRLYDDGGETLNITEGVEVGLAVRLVCRQTVWASYSSSLMQSLVVPKDRFKRVRIWADLDPLSQDGKKGGAGIKAALKLAKRLVLEGFQVQILLPGDVLPSCAEKGVDWEDVIIREGLPSLASNERGRAIKNLAAPQSTVGNLRTRLEPVLFGQAA